MLQSLVPVLLLVTVALSSSNVLPILSINQLDTEPGFNSQHDDNIPSNNRLQNILHFYKLPDTPQTREYYYSTDNKPEEFEDTVTKEDTYDGKGFRKEQWHNYPRQLDRLNVYDPEKVTPDYDDPGNDDDGMDTFEPKKIVNEFPINSKVSDDLISILADPLLVLKIHLGNLVNGTVDEDFYKYMKLRQLEEFNRRGNNNSPLDNSEYPTHKREQAQTTNSDMPDQKKTVKKRIFSLWSRLQSLSHKGHELQHRRHIYALYNNLQDSGSNGAGGILTAETRAFLRPPGSPLRWG